MLVSQRESRMHCLPAIALGRSSSIGREMTRMTTSSKTADQSLMEILEKNRSLAAQEFMWSKAILPEVGRVRQIQPSEESAARCLHFRLRASVVSAIR